MYTTNNKSKSKRHIPHHTLHCITSLYCFYKNSECTEQQQAAYPHLETQERAFCGPQMVIFTGTMTV